MASVTVAVWTLVWISLAFLLYKFVFNPQIVIQSSIKSLSACPERWTLKDGMCHPDYQTTCIPFDPKTITTLGQACNIAKTCGTDWSGLCL